MMIRSAIFSKITFASLSLLLPSIVIAATDPAKIKKEIDRIHQVDAALAKGGISEMLATASQQGIDAPKINSKYFAQLIAKREPGLAPLEDAKRSFGLNVARALDGVAVELQHQSASKLRAGQITQLLDLAEWSKKQTGYGNYFLVVRCENLAAVPLAYLTADLGFPMEEITVLQNRIMPRAEEREFRKTVLNHEAPAPFIGELTGTQSEQDRQMQSYWNREWMKMRKWLKNRGIAIENADQSTMPYELAFFVEERDIEPFTTTVNWNVNRHAGLVNGFRDKNVDNVSGFARYRKLVGKFPTEPPKWWRPDDKLHTAREAAFIESWKPFFKNDDPSCGEAMIVFEQVSSGTLIDGETRLKELATKSSR